MVNMGWRDSLADIIKGSSSSDNRSKSTDELDKHHPLSKSGGLSRGKPKSEGVDRPSFSSLEEYYYLEPLVFAGVNFYAMNIAGEDFILEGTNDNYIHKLRDFTYRSNLQEKKRSILRDLAIFGNSFEEIIWNKKGNEIKDLAILDPKNMEFIKKGSGYSNEVAVDDMGDPIGYIQKVNRVGMSNKNRERYDDIAKDFDLEPDDLQIEQGIPFHRNEIAHFRLQKLSDSLMGVGIVEPVVDVLELKMSVESTLEKGVKKSAVPDLIGKVDSFDEEEPARSADIEDLKKSLVKMRKKEFGVISIPEYWDVDTISSDMGGIDEYYKNLNDLVSVGMGIPPGLLSRGEGVSSNIADIQYSFNDKVMQSFQNSFARDCRQQIFSQVLDEDDVNEIPKLVWKELSYLSKGKKVNRIGELARGGLITQDRRLENHLRELEGLPLLPEETEEEKVKREEERQEKIKGKGRKKKTLDE